MPQIRAFVAAFARRQAARTVDLPGGYAVLDDAYAHSHGNNHVVVDGAVDPEALPALADETLGHLKHRAITVLDDATGTACAAPLIRAGYHHSAELVMLHTGPVPDGGPAAEVDLDAFRTPSPGAGAASSRRPTTRSSASSSTAARSAGAVRTSSVSSARGRPRETSPPGRTSTSTPPQAPPRSRTSSPPRPTSAAATPTPSCPRRCARPSMPGAPPASSSPTRTTGPGTGTRAAASPPSAASTASDATDSVVP